MFLEHLRSGRVAAISGNSRALWSFHHDLIIEALKADAHKPIIFLDGAHVLNGYDIGEANILRGREAEEGVDRILTCRAMTPFQWGKMLTSDLHDQLDHYRPSLVVAAGFNVQFDKDDLVDWEQENYVKSSLAMMRRLARIHQVPLVLTLDLSRWSRTHPTAARLLIESGIDALRLERTNGWVLSTRAGIRLLEPPCAEGTLDHYVPKTLPELTTNLPMD